VRDSSLVQNVTAHLAELYPDYDTPTLTDQCLKAMEINELVLPSDSDSALWNNDDIVLITYADSITSESKTPLETLKQFLDRHLKEVFSVVHILPFFPYSSDDGFSVIDYSSVNQSHGDWRQIEAVGEHFKIMGDLVLNHCSTRSLWFENFKKGRDPGKDFFITVEPDAAIDQVVRPRTSGLLRPTRTDLGEILVWCTFSHDQADLNFKNPMVLLEFLKIIHRYLEKGISWFRLDAVGFVWKELGTSCINLPKTHTIIKLIRLMIEKKMKKSVLITETNLPNVENLSYFGDDDEAHLIYNFSLPPLLLNTLITGDHSQLKRWIMTMPPARPGTAYLNLLASHDGIGLRPIEGLLSATELKKLIDTMIGFGGQLSYRTTKANDEQPYEINISLWDALAGTVEQGKDNCQFNRFICAHAILLSLEGIPAIYIHSIVATENDLARLRNTGNLRSINRHVWDQEELESNLANADSRHSRALNRLLTLIRVRKKQKAFHPNAKMLTLHLGPGLLGFWRQSLDREQNIFAIFNVTNETRMLDTGALNLTIDKTWTDLLDGASVTDRSGLLELEPYRFLWIGNDF
tara:strand:+ start:3231 stop:4964 length:1734 start_codon:yes stop_codon:yes gene_type:complete